MKNIVKIFMLGLLFSFASCTDSEALIDNVLETVNTETGGVVRTVVPLPDLVTLTNPAANSINTTFEVQQGNGSFVPDFKEVRAYIRLYLDQDLIEPVTTDDGAEVPEQLLETFDASTFAISTNGLPRRDVTIETQGIVDLYPNSTLAPPRFIALRLELEMTDGTIYTNTDVGPNVSGGLYFNAPFLYRIIFLPI
jgi:hypothetical protein